MASERLLSGSPTSAVGRSSFDSKVEAFNFVHPRGARVRPSWGRTMIAGKTVHFRLRRKLSGHAVGRIMKEQHRPAPGTWSWTCFDGSARGRADFKDEAGLCSRGRLRQVRPAASSWRKYMEPSDIFSSPFGNIDPDFLVTAQLSVHAYRMRPIHGDDQASTRAHPDRKRPSRRKASSSKCLARIIARCVTVRAQCSLDGFCHFSVWRGTVQAPSARLRLRRPRMQIPAPQQQRSASPRRRLARSPYNPHAASDTKLEA